MIRRLALAAALCTAASLPALAQDSTRTSVDWDGYYTATVPCADCSGIETWLHLNDAGGTTHYELIETYLGKSDKPFVSKGKAVWNKDGSRLALKGKDENRVLFVSEGFAELMGAGQKQPDKNSAPYRLSKVAAYAGLGQQLLVSPARIKADKGTVSFKGLVNFEHRMQGGHRSLRADVVIACKAKTYTMPNISYFKGSFAHGLRLDFIKGNTNPPQKFAGKDDVFAQVAAAHCPK